MNRPGAGPAPSPGGASQHVLELREAERLAVTRRFREGDALIRSGSWDGWKPLELLGSSLGGKTLGVYEMGRIGTAVRRRAEAFGMKVVGTDGSDPAEAFERLLAGSDVLTIHTPLPLATRGRFGVAELARTACEEAARVLRGEEPRNRVV